MENRGLLSEIRDFFLGKTAGELQRLAVCLVSTFLIGLCAHSWGFSHLMVSQDSLGEFYWGIDWKFFLGRYLEPAVRYFMGEKIVLPWLTGLFGMLFLAVSVYLISRTFSLERVWENVALSGICVANGALTTLIATYLHDFAGDMLALLLAVYAFTIWADMRGRFSWKKTLWGAGCLFICTAIYPAYLAVAITLIVMLTVVELLKGKSAKEAMADLVKAIPMGALAVAAFGVLAAVMVRLLHFEMGGTGGSDMTKMGSNFSRLLPLIGQAYMQVLRDWFLVHWTSVKAVFGPTGWLICLINMVLALKAVGIVVRQFKGQKMKMPEILMTLLLLVLLPLCMSCVSVASSVFHYLMRFANYLFYLLILAVFRLGRENGQEQNPVRQQLITLGLIGIVVLNNVQVSNTAYAKKDLEQKSTLSSMTRIIDRLEVYEDYEFGVSEVAFPGILSSHQARLRVGTVDSMLGLGPASQVADDHLEGRFLQIYMNYPINICPADKEREIMATEAFQAMGAFPARDCIATIDGVIVVKMSDADYDGLW